MSEVTVNKLTKSALAQRLGFSERKLDLMVARGELPAGRRVGRQLHWIEAVALRWEQREYAEQAAWAAQK